MNGLRTDRRLGRYAGKQGPTLLVVGGIHGNEPAGVLAAQDVLAQLEEGGIEVAGSLAAVAGNVGALAAARRYLVRDLNRCWLPEDIARLATHPASDDDPEYAEMRALAAVIDEEAAQAERLVILDLHTTSGDSPPFSLMSDTLRNRRLARALPVPVILGLEENVDGTLLECASAAPARGRPRAAARRALPPGPRRHGATWKTVLSAPARVEDRRFIDYHSPFRARTARTARPGAGTGARTGELLVT